MKISIIVSCAKNNVIGYNNTIPWYISNDLKYFKLKTMGKPIIMGRNTFESIGHPLLGRTNIVVTRNKNYKILSNGILTTSIVVNCFKKSIKIAKLIAKKDNMNEIMIIGGSQIYKLAMKIVNRIYITKINIMPKGNIFFPEFNKLNWKKIFYKDIKSNINNAINYEFFIYEKIHN